ncbi:MAG: mannosyltransferase [Myxococcaceae bacterium]|nr:mannosyltransferase [Myxococcaceae bacterium]
MAVTWPTEVWRDEIFQTLEQAHRLAFGYGIVPWEFRTGIRSWLVPGLLAGVMKLAPESTGSRGVLFLVNVALCFASLAPVATAIAWARRAGIRAAWVAGLVCAIWFELVFFSSKALTEVFAGYALAAALLWTVRAREEKGRRPLLVAGALLGLVLGLRFHLAPAALVAFWWACRDDWKRWGWMALGAGAVLLGFGLLDAVTWSWPFQSILLNFWINVVEHKAESFGESPVWEYPVSLARVWGWGAIPLLVLGALGARRAPVLAWAALAILVSHSFVSHKEYRFLFPLLVLVVLAAALGIVELLRTRRRLGLLGALAFLFASASGALRYDFRDMAPLAENADKKEPMNVWTFRRGELEVMRLAGMQPDLCGLGIFVLGWGDTGGYTWLHRDVPFLEFRPEHPPERVLYANYAIGPRSLGESWGPYSVVRCEYDACLLKRPGGCSGQYDLNVELARTGH